MLRRPPSSPFMAMVNPSPSEPIMLAAGTRQSSKMTAAVGCEFQPSWAHLAHANESGGVGKGGGRAGVAWNHTFFS